MTTNIVFDKHGRTKPGKEGPVEIRITEGTKSVYIGTGVKCRRSEFHGGEIAGRADAPELNAMVDAVRKRVLEVATELISEGKGIDAKEIKRRVMGRKGQNAGTGGHDMYGWFEGQMKMLGHKEGTMKHYVTLMGRLKEYGALMSWQDLTAENICKFDAWLHQNLKKPQKEADRKAGREPEPISDAGVYSYHKCLKALLNRALTFGMIKQNPYDRLKGKFRRGDNAAVEYLTKEEMAAVESLHPVRGSAMASARDLFVFQMHTGLSYADTQSFDFGEYRKINGVWVNVAGREKTGVDYVTRLDAECLSVLGRYGNSLPKMDNSDYNMCLKALGMAAGIERPLHSHMARHSFATYMLSQGARIENVSKMLGHANITQTQRYAKVLAKDVLDDFAKIDGK